MKEKAAIEVFRQAAESRIIVNAHRINKGLMPEFPEGNEPSDFYFVAAEDADEGVRKIIEIVKKYSYLNTLFT